MAQRAKKGIGSSETAETAMEQASSGQERPERPRFIVPDAMRARVWELHLRGMPKARIAREPDVALHPETVTRIIREAYKEVGQERKSQVKVKLDAAVARLRRLQEQAWADHDADDAREHSVLALALSAAHSESSGEHGERPSSAGSIRYQSQRSQYLRVIMDAEKEIARLEGLYEATDDTGGAIVFRIERVGQSGLTVISDPLSGVAGIAAATGDTSGDTTGDTTGAQAEDGEHGDGDTAAG